MNLNETVAQAVAVSTPVANAVLSSISWSGASRVANHITGKKVLNATELKVAEDMAKQASRVTEARIRPTTDDVLALIKSEPEPVTLSQEERQLFLDNGDTDAEIDAVLAQDHREAMNRHEADLPMLLAKEQEIREYLDTLFKARPRTLPALPESMDDIKARVISKVAKRKPRIAVDLSYKRIDPVQAKTELQNINAFLAKAA